jgi:uncharacterized membrane protein (Fun14 family)
MTNIVIDPSFLGTVGFGGIVGFLLGYVLKKIAKILAVIAGVFFAAILYFESNGIINANWDKLQSITQSTVSSLTSLITTASNGNNSSTLLPITNLGLPLTGSAAAGFAIGFIKG